MRCDKHFATETCSSDKHILLLHHATNIQQENAMRQTYFASENSDTANMFCYRNMLCDKHVLLTETSMRQTCFDNGNNDATNMF